MRKKNRFLQQSLLVAVIALSIEYSATVHAQPQSEQDTGWGFNVGAGLLSNPNYTGDDDRQLMLVPLLKASYGQHWTIGLPEGVQYSINPDNQWQWAVAVGPAFGRDTDGSNPFRISGDATNDLLGLDDIKTSVALQVMSEFDFDDFSIKAKVQQNVGNDSQGTLTLGLSRSGVLKFNGPPLILSGGVRMRFGNRQSVVSLVGVTPEQSAASGLAEYEPDAGLMSYGVNGTAVLPLSSALTLIGNLSIDQLAEALADSSLVQERGDDVQVSAGLFLSYKL